MHLVATISSFLLIVMIATATRCGAAFAFRTASVAPQFARTWWDPSPAVESFASWKNRKEMALVSRGLPRGSRPISIGLNVVGENDEEAGAADGADAVKPSWTYVPYKPPPPYKGPGRQQRRNYTAGAGGEWKVPNKVTIPLDRLEMSFARSSGAGGQNVNKVNTKVEIRFHLMSANWIPLEVRERIRSNESRRINNDGYLTVVSQEYRTQAQNRKDALSKLEEIVLKNYPRPKVRKMRKGISKKAKERNKEQKKMRSEVKANRKRVDF